VSRPFSEVQQFSWEGGKVLEAVVPGLGNCKKNKK
jgi:hypothetical protein